MVTIARQGTDLPRSAAFDHGRLTSRPVSFGILNTFCRIKLRCNTVFHRVDSDLLRMSRYVTVITAREVSNIKWHIHIGAVTIIVNNREHTLHYAIEEEIKSRTFLISSPSVVEERGCHYFKGFILI